MDKQHFTVVAGFSAVLKHDELLAAAAAKPGFDLPRWQQTSDPTIAAEIVVTIYGYGLRYASGLQNFGIIRSAQDIGTLDRAIAYAQNWVAGDRDGERFVFIRNSALAEAGAIAAKVAVREAGIAQARRLQAEANARLLEAQS